MFKKILVAYDDGKHSRKALDTAVELAQGTSAEIYIASVYSVPANDWERYATIDGVDRGTISAFNEDERKDIDKIQAEAGEKVSQAGITIHTIVKQGAPGPTLLKIVDEEQIDLVVIGSHNRGAVSNFFMGSVSNYVVHNAECAVLVVKE